MYFRARKSLLGIRRKSPKESKIQDLSQHGSRLAGVVFPSIQAIADATVSVKISSHKVGQKGYRDIRQLQPSALGNTKVPNVLQAAIRFNLAIGRWRARTPDPFRVKEVL